MYKQRCILIGEGVVGILQRIEWIIPFVSNEKCYYFKGTSSLMLPAKHSNNATRSIFTSSERREIAGVMNQENCLFN